MSGELTARPLGPDDDPLWEEGLLQSTQGTWLQWLPWHRISCELLGRLEVFGVWRDGELVAGLAGVVLEGDGQRSFHNNFMTAHHGLWMRDIGLRPAKVETLLSEIAAALVPLLSERFDRWAFSCTPELSDARPFADLGCQVDVHFTHRLALRDFESQVNLFEKEARRWVRHAQQAGITCAASALAEEDLAAAERHLRGIAERESGGALRDTRGVFRALISAAQRAGHGQLFLARDAAGQVVASVLCTWDRWRAYSFLGGATDEGMAIGAPRLLDAFSFAWLHGQGHREIDLLGANHPGLRAFKKDYNGALVPYVTIRGGRERPLSRWDHLRAAARHVALALRP